MSMQTERQLQVLYCARKYVVEHNLVDTNVPEIRYNPTNMALEGIDCEALIEEKFKNLEDQFVEMLPKYELGTVELPESTARNSWL